MCVRSDLLQAPFCTAKYSESLFILIIEFGEKSVASYSNAMINETSLGLYVWTQAIVMFPYRKYWPRVSGAVLIRLLRAPLRINSLTQSFHGRNFFRSEA